MADNVPAVDVTRARLYVNASFYAPVGQTQPLAWVECEYCKRGQERPAQGQCCGCGAPIRLRFGSR